MKRILIFFAILLPIIGFSQKVQNKLEVYTDNSEYLGGTAYHYDGYIQTPIYDSLGISYKNMVIDGSGFITSPDSVYAMIMSCYVDGYLSDDANVIAPRGFAQPMHTDTLLCIGGVAIYVRMENAYLWTDLTLFDLKENVLDTICILDGTTLEPIYKKVLNDTLGDDYIGMYEIIFDSAVCVQGDYYIAYKYCDNNIAIKYNPNQYSTNGTKLAIYNLSLSAYISLHRLISSTQAAMVHPYENYNRQIKLLNYDCGWINSSDFCGQFLISDLTATEYGVGYVLGGITSTEETDLFPQDKDKFAHTTDLIVFGIKESAIIDSIDRPWLFAQDTTITDSTDTNFISQIDLERMIAVHPNPTKGEVFISSPEPMREVALLNPMGQVLYHENYNQKRITLDLSSYPQGVYILHLQTPSGEVRKKIVKQ